MGSTLRPSGAPTRVAVVEREVLEVGHGSFPVDGRAARQRMRCEYTVRNAAIPSAMQAVRFGSSSGQTR